MMIAMSEDDDMEDDDGKVVGVKDEDEMGNHEEQDVHVNEKATPTVPKTPFCSRSIVGPC